MKYKVRLLIFLFYASVFAQKQNSSIGFIENKGQIVDQKGRQNKSVLYLLNTHGLNVQLKKNGFSYDVYETKKHPLSEKEKRNRFTSAFSKEDTIKNPNYKLEYIYHRIDIDFLNSSKRIEVVADEKSTDYDNYYNVTDAPNGITNVHKYKKITYKNIYEHIDVVFFIPEDVTKSVEYNFIVRPAGKVSDIQLQFNGVKTELVDNKIKMAVRFGEMEETLPLSWTEDGASKKEVAIHYQKIRNNVYGFEGVLASDKTVIIDPVPVRLWGTYYGGEDLEYPTSLTTNSNNDVYIAGASGSSVNVATSGTNQSMLNGSWNIFIAKLNTNGNRIWGTYFYTDLGTNNSQSPKIKIDSNNNVYFTGKETYNTNLGTPGTFQPIKNLYNDVYLVKLNDSGIKIWGTYYGGNGSDESYSICIDAVDYIYISGATWSTDVMSSSGAHQTVNNSNFNYQDAFIAKFSPDGNRIWGTFYGGLGSEGFFNISISNDGFLYASGVRNSNSHIATANSYQSVTTANSGGMIVKFDLNGNRIWGTYIADNSYILNAKLEGNNLYIAGPTWNQTSISTTNTFFENYQTVPSSSYGSNESSYVINFNVQTQQKIWGTYFKDAIIGIDTNNSNETFISGSTLIDNGITTLDAYMPLKVNALSDAYIVKLNNLGQRVWGTYYGGNGADVWGNITLDNNQNIYLYGITLGSTQGISTPNAHQTIPGSSQDTYLVKFFDCQSATTATSNSPICIGNSIQLNATGGTNYSWTGPNGFTSTDQNPTITNATSLNSGQYSCLITGTGGCDNTITVNVFVGDTVAPIPDTTTLPDVTGDCNTIITTIPTALDNCAGTLTATTVDPLNYSTSGTYIIHWSYNDGNGNTSTQNQNVIISETPLPTLTSPQNFCIQQNATLNSIAVTGQNIQWYDALTNGNLLSNSTILANGTIYYASQTITNCESKRVPVTINIQNTSAPTGTNQSFCASQNATLTDVILTGTAISWYVTNTSTDVLAVTTILTNAVTYYATQTVNNCESVTRLPITVTLINTLNATNFAVEFCDDLNDGAEIVNLTSYNANLISNSTNCTFAFYNSFIGATNQTISDVISNVSNFVLGLGAKTLFVRITSSNGCHQIVELKVTLQPKPILTIRDIEPICENATVTIYGDIGYDDYTWSTGEKTTSITVSNPGDYFLTVIKKYATIDCSTTKNFKVVASNVATISEIITSDWTTNDNSIVVLLTNNSLGNYEYSIDEINYQDNNIFSDLNSGEYNIYVRDKNGCGIIEGEAYLLMYPKFFTPNGDGFNDTWKIKFSENEPNLKIKIFDRFGNLLKDLDTNSEGWNGLFNGQNLPSTDYWFTIIRANGKEYKGHFAMKR